MNTEKIKGFKLVGLQLQHKTSNANGKSAQDCGALWQRFEKEKIATQIPDKLNEALYAVYFDYEGDHSQPFGYFIGCRVAQDAPVPPGLISLTIPDQQYIKVVAKGKMPDCMANAWRQIWKTDYMRAYGYDFEVYDRRSHDWNDAEVDIYLSVG